MKRVLIGLALMMPLAACTATERGAAIGGGGGALIGAAVASPGREAEGALVGGALGAVAGALIGESSERRGYCEYRDRRGRIYTDRCPDRDRRYRDRRYRDDDYYYDDY